MKKIKCEKYKYYFGVSFFGFLGISNLLGFQQWSKYYGWQEPDKIFGIIFLVIAIAIYTYTTKICTEIKILKCKNCKEVFSEVELINNKCPLCTGDTIDIKDYYDTSNKTLEEK